jgi:hypothetical protein
MGNKIEFPKISDKRGNLTFIEYPQNVPFEIKRIFWLYNVPGGEKRGGHAYKTQEEIIIALSGSFDVVITDKNGEMTTITLNRSYQGLYLPALTWRHLENFSTNAQSLHLSSLEFSNGDYIRDFHTYKLF